MWYLFFQIWVWILVAFILGWFAHWFFCCRNSDDSAGASNNNSDSTADGSSMSEGSSKENINTAVGIAGSSGAAIADSGLAISDDWKPQGFASRPEQVDDLKRVKGVGAVIEETLNNLGIYQFSQISAWNQDNISWVESFLSFPGRVGREGWVDQARTLSGGGTTEFASRVDKGEVDYD